MTKIHEYAKFAVALLTVLTTAGVGLIPGEFIDWLQLVIALIGAVAVYAVPNAPTKGAHEA
jgi:hypothetical protein